MQVSARKHSDSDFRRARIREAAQTVLRENGVAGVNMRAVAAQAGYTPGALYTYYPGKDDLLADLLAERLKSLASGTKPEGSGLKAVVGQWASGLLTAVLADDALADLFLAVSGAADKGDTPCHKALNGQTIMLLRQLADALRRHSVDSDKADRETMQIYAHIAGLVLLVRGGMLDMTGQIPQDMLVRYIADMETRLRPAHKHSSGVE